MTSRLEREPEAVATAQDIIEIAGPLPDARLMAILTAGATVRQLEEAVARAAGDSDVLGKLEPRVCGPVAEIYDILTAEEQYAGDRE